MRIWALLGARPGDNNQVIALAEALGRPFEIKQLEYNALRRLGPRVLGHSLVSLTKASRESVLAGAPPDLTISAGHRSVPVVRALRHRSSGRTSSIHVGFPRVSPGHFDLVVATPQYPIPDHPNLLRVPYALTRAATADADAIDGVQLAMYPQPRRLLIVGGPNLYWRIDRPALLGALSAMLDEARDRGGSVLVTTSPRTPDSIHAAITSTLAASTVPTLLAVPGQPPNYRSLLAAANSMRITADSVAMVSDAIWTGKPIALVPVSPTVLGSMAMGILNRLRPGRRLYPQDLRFFWRALSEAGISDRLAVPGISTNDEMRAILARVRRVLDDRQ